MEAITTKTTVFNSLKGKYQESYKRNPKLLKTISDTIAVMYTLLTITIPNFLNLPLLTAGVLVVLFLLVYFNQGLLHEAHLDDKMKLKDEELSEIKTQAAQQVRLLASYNHTLQEITSEAIYLMNCYDSSKNINRACYTAIDKLINDFEQSLTTYYSMPISASIKLQNGNGMVGTWCRGKNCQKSRQSLKKKKLYFKHPWKSNTAFTHILENGYDYFSSPDLLVEKDFCCELDSQEWQRAFRSTVVMPIRIKVLSNSRVKDALIGLLCIDANEPNPEWHQEKFGETVGFCLVSMFCLNIYTLLNLRKRRISFLNQMDRAILKEA